MASKFMVLDVEGYQSCKPYDVGFKITDKTGKTFEEYSIAVMPAVFENMCYKAEKQNVASLATAHEMAHRNIEEICNDTKEKYMKCYDIDKFYFAFVGIIQKYNIKRIWAYNCTFDRGALHRLFGDERFAIVEKMVEFCDIIPAILHTKLLDKKYIDFCKNNGFITNKGNIQTKAEVVYKYLTNNIDFVEQHTGLADVQIETQILLTAMRESKNIKRKPCVAWKVLKEFCIVNDIEIPTPDFKNMMN